MSGLEQRLPVLSKMRYKHLSQLENNIGDIDKDKGGAATTSLSSSLRFLGVSDFKLKSDVESFREKLSRSAKCRLSLYRRHEKGESIPESYLSMMSFKSLLDALAAGDFSLAEELASVMGGRKPIEEENDSPFVRAFGYMLKSLVLNLDDKNEKLALLKSAVSIEENKDFSGYADACEAILNDDIDLLNKAILLILAGHERQSKGKGLFKDDIDEVLCIWGVGLINLAKSKGMGVKSDSDLLPSSLIL